MFTWYRNMQVTLQPMVTNKSKDEEVQIIGNTTKRRIKFWRVDTVDITLMDMLQHWPIGQPKHLNYDFFTWTWLSFPAIFLCGSKFNISQPRKEIMVTIICRLGCTAVWRGALSWCRRRNLARGRNKLFRATANTLLGGSHFPILMCPYGDDTLSRQKGQSLILT